MKLERLFHKSSKMC